MMPALSLFAALAIPAALQPLPVTQDPEITVIVSQNAVTFHVTGPDGVFVGAALGSLAPDLAYYLVGLPPLLADFVVLDIGIGDAQAGYTAVLPASVLPQGITLYTQGVTIDDLGLRSTNVTRFRVGAP